MLPEKPRGILLDIEGTTSSISFVHDVMFPFVLERLDDFLSQNFSREDVQASCQQIARDAGYESIEAWHALTANSPMPEVIAVEIRRLMAGDVKATGLKSLQGLIWHGGFQSGELQSHVYPDVLPSIRNWKQAGIDVRIYSSGSIAAQKLFFGHVNEEGDCLHLFSGHYDTTIGGKKEPDSYRRLVTDWGLPESKILFVSDIAAELEAANSAGLMTVASVRPGNAPLPASLSSPRVESFEQIAF